MIVGAAVTHCGQMDWCLNTQALTAVTEVLVGRVERALMVAVRIWAAVAVTEAMVVLGAQLVVELLGLEEREKAVVVERECWHQHSRGCSQVEAVAEVVAVVPVEESVVPEARGAAERELAAAREEVAQALEECWWERLPTGSLPYQLVIVRWLVAHRLSTLARRLLRQASMFDLGRVGSSSKGWSLKTRYSGCHRSSTTRWYLASAAAEAGRGLNPYSGH